MGETSKRRVEPPTSKDRELWVGLLDYTTNKSLCRLIQPPHPRGGRALPAWQCDISYAGEQPRWAPLHMGGAELRKACASLAARLAERDRELVAATAQLRRAADGLVLALNALVKAGADRTAEGRRVNDLAFETCEYVAANAARTTAAESVTAAQGGGDG